MFLKEINDQLAIAMKEKDSEKLTALRNIKSDFIYLTQKTSETESEIISILAKTRRETVKIYEGKSEALRDQELRELEILHPFLPEEVNWQDVFQVLRESGIPKEMRNFKKFQEVVNAHFGQKIDSDIIKDYITN